VKKLTRRDAVFMFDGGSVSVRGRAELPFLRGLTISGVARMMSGRPFSIYDSSIDATWE
jgi:hypothetical protein